MSEKDEKEDENQLDRFASSSMRGPKRGIYQQLLALLLVKANRSNDQLIKILSICEAVLMSRKKKKLDMDAIDRIYTVVKSFAASEIRNIPYSYLYNKSMIDIVKMAWTFPPTEENWKKTIEPWQKAPITYYWYHTNWRRNKHPFKDRMKTYWQYTEYHNEAAAYLERVKEKVEEELEVLPEWQRFYEGSSALTRSSFNALQGEFTRWSLKQLLETQAIIAEEVDPEIYKETLALTIKGEREEAKK